MVLATQLTLHVYVMRDGNTGRIVNAIVGTEEPTENRLTKFRENWNFPYHIGDDGIQVPLFRGS